MSVDPATGVVMVGDVKRLSKEAAAVVRECIANGQEVVFKDRHQWRHFHRHQSVR
ncbi:hypothetical protein [Reticulibacter mediterranei]|uniref:hypothetical protein n=1 Tax=Reticulibacter mediterranei TaxID=2778369 RepID=UPI001C68ED44|nr:hypothetical protein [Reticulibacter mediterranei]